MTILKRFSSTATAVALLAGMTAGAAGCSGDDGGSGNAKITLRYSWWGNADRAKKMQQALDLYKTKNPNIVITPSFQEYKDYWTKIATETAGGNAPDVLQMDFSYLREYADRHVLLDLTTQEGKGLDVTKLLPAFGGAGQINGKRLAVPIGGNTWSMYYDPAAFAKAGVAEPKLGWTWDDYYVAMDKITKADEGRMWGGADPGGRLYNLEAQLRQRGKLLFTEAGKLGFTKEELTEFWRKGEDLRAAKSVIPAAKIAEIEPKPAMSADLIASEPGWDNFLIRYAGETKRALKLGPLPTNTPGRLGQYLKPSMLLSASGKTKHPEEAAKLIDFLINDPEVGKIFGANRGIPASKVQRDAAQFTGPEKAIVDYEDGIADQLQKTPPAPPKGAGTIEAAFLRINEELAYDKVDLTAAVEQFFKEAAETLGA